MRRAALCFCAVLPLGVPLNLPFGCTDLTVLDHKDPKAVLPLGTIAHRWRHADFTGKTELVATTLNLITSVPATVAACRMQWPTESTACLDADADGLSDRWELIALHRLRPFVRMHSDEPLFRDFHGKVVGSGRVMPTADGRIRMLLAIVFSNDYGRCSATRHRGDPERVAIDLEIVDSNTTRVVGTFTASHEGTGLDGSKLLVGRGLEGLEYASDEETGMPRWVVYSSVGKHAMYPSTAACKSKGFPVCLDDDCAARNDSYNDLLPDVYNVGEPNSLDFEFQGDAQADPFREATPSLQREQVWGQQDYCGDIPAEAVGSYSDACAGPIRDKLLNDPFGG